MFQLGQKQTLQVVREVGFGVYLAENSQQVDADKELQSGAESVLLPKSQLPETLQVGDSIEVFLYKDSEDRIIATCKEPLLQLHQVGFLTVKQVSRIGAFLDWGLDKDLLLPFHEQPRDHHVIEGQEVLVAVYLDKSSRLCATMNVYPYLRKDSEYHTGDRVTGTVYETSDNFGTFVAVDNIFSALIPKRELVRELRIGETISARVTAVKPDGKLDLSIRETGVVQIDRDAAKLQQILDAKGRIPFTDKADPALIRQELQMSKNEFKKAVGRLLKEGKIRIGKDEITAIEK